MAVSNGSSPEVVSAVACISTASSMVEPVTKYLVRVERVRNTTSVVLLRAGVEAVYVSGMFQTFATWPLTYRTKPALVAIFRIRWKLASMSTPVSVLRK